MKDLNISRLKDVYGNMLTDKQSEAIEQYYNLDYSLAEIGQNLCISRQGVYFLLKQGVQKLEDCESKLGFLKKIDEIAVVIDSGIETNDISTKDKSLAQVLEMIKS